MAVTHVDSASLVEAVLKACDTSLLLREASWPIALGMTLASLHRKVSHFSPATQEWGDRQSAQADIPIAGAILGEAPTAVIDRGQGSDNDSTAGVTDESLSRYIPHSVYILNENALPLTFIGGKPVWQFTASFLPQVAETGMEVPCHVRARGRGVANGVCRTPFNRLGPCPQFDFPPLQLLCVRNKAQTTCRYIILCPTTPWRSCRGGRPIQSYISHRNFNASELRITALIAAQHSEYEPVIRIRVAMFSNNTGARCA